jgi:hypothetical protein
MSAVKEEVKSLLDRLPEDCTIEDVQYHLYVMEKIGNGIRRAESEGALSHQDVERRLSRWLVG